MDAVFIESFDELKEPCVEPSFRSKAGIITILLIKKMVIIAEFTAE